MGSRRPWREARKASRPVASTRKRARRVRSPSPSLSRTVTPSASKATFSTVAGWSTRAPSAHRVVEEDLVELRAVHVEGEVRPRPPLAEGEGGLALELLVVEGHAELVEEAVRLDLVEHAQPREDGHAVGHQRLADLEAREDLALHHGDVEPAAGEEGRGGGAAGPAAHDEDVGVVGHASITRCAARRRAGGTVIPRSRAVRKLRTSSKWVGCSMGRSAGRAPRSNRSA